MNVIDETTIETFLNKKEPIIEFAEAQAIVKMLYEIYKTVKEIYRKTRWS